MRVRLISVGRQRSDPTAPLVADYLSRIRRFVPVEEKILKPERADRIAARMLREAGRNRLLVALDERGRQLRSGEMADLLQSWMNRGIESATFAIGGRDGLPDRVRESADQTLALSAMTLPHRLARLLLAEQIYRALCILRGDPYAR
ncbi:MAG: 23S rRNA (pseudouridine(1915)-N(3))-methyltransferase RlmH [Polyangia bacterium]